MKILQSYSNISFQKKLVAKASVSVADATDKNIPCKIYKLSSEKDKKYFDKMPNIADWENSEFLDDFKRELKFEDKYSEIYSIEDKNENCLGLMELLDDVKSEMKSVIYLETCPVNASTNENRKVKYVGESLLAFVAALAKKRKTKVLTVPVFLSSAESFYKDKCGFEQGFSCGLNMFEDKYNQLIDGNAKHTGHKIKLVI